MNEKELITLLKQGSQRAFDSLYQMYSKRLYAYCYQYTKSREKTEEIVQDVFMKLWTNKSSIHQEDTIKHLLFTIAKNQLINAYKSNVNSFVFENYVDYCNKEELSVNDTGHIVEYEDFCKALQKVMTHLSDTQQKVFDYCKLRQLSNKETARRLSLQEQTVKNQLSIALKILREELSKIITLIFLLIIK
ncbi:DNA-directed RNA polymerase sigma-70 factor [Bacteroidia bacterium]|nr:DNA-directed RNA polymerase sigma-70 factor [Bacteroidia bacterium]